MAVTIAVTDRCQLDCFHCSAVARDSRRSKLAGRDLRKIVEESLDLAQKRLRFRPRILTQSWTNSHRGFARRLGCLAANYQFHITARGEFTPCDFTPLSFGSAVQEPLQKLWDKQLRHPAYREHCFHCRMQSGPFRRKYIDPIPAGAVLPYPIEKLGFSE